MFTKISQHCEIFLNAETSYTSVRVTEVIIFEENKLR